MISNLNQAPSPESFMVQQPDLTFTVEINFVTFEAVKRTRIFLYWFLSIMPSSAAFTGINTPDDHVFIWYVHALECGLNIPNTA